MAGGFLNFVKTILLPLLFSLGLYLLFTFILLPLYRRHHQRYSQYLPVSSISTRTSSLRGRLSMGIMAIFLPSTWAFRNRNRFFSPGVRHMSQGDSDSDGSLFDDEEGEGMVGFEIDEAVRRGRREAIESGTHGDVADVDSGRRLSRELEEGFRDDSDDEDARGEGHRGVERPTIRR